MSDFNTRMRSVLPDVLQILLCTYTTHVLAMRPLAGAAVYAVFMIVKVAVVARCSKLPQRRVAGHLLLACSVLGPVFYLVYPITGDGWVGTALCAIVVMRTALFDVFSGKAVRALVQLLILGAFAASAYRAFTTGQFTVAISVYAASGMLLFFKKDDDESIAHDSPMEGIASYKLFSGMAFYTYLSCFLGLIFYACFVGLSGVRAYTVLYAAMLIWLFLGCILTELFHRMLKKRGSRAERLGVYILGALAAAFAYYRLFSADGVVDTLLYSALWAFGFACMSAVMNRINADYKLVAKLDGRDVERVALEKHMRFLRDIAVAEAGVLFLAATAVYYAFTPVQTYGATDLAVFFARLLPLCCLAVSVGFALKQPIDERNRQRLLVFFSRDDNGEATRLRMRELFITKYRVKIGAKLLAYLLRPFLRMKVRGKRHIIPSEFPSVFVCNHGAIYGPVAAVMYLPVYFRPWSDDRMVNGELIEKHMYEGTFKKWPFGRWFAKKFSRPVIWAITSFEPIVVARSSMKGILKTMEDTAFAMAQSDNVLIFPEDPSQCEDGRYASEGVGPFFTGFVNIGKLYFERTEREALFYPVTANRKKRAFTIGKPVRYDSKAPAREERKRLSDALHEAMTNMLKEDKSR